MTPTGIEPVLPPWKGDVLTAWPRSLILFLFLIWKNSPSRARTYNNSVNSRVLYHWAIEDHLRFLCKYTCINGVAVTERLCLEVTYNTSYKNKGLYLQNRYRTIFHLLSKLSFRSISTYPLNTLLHLHSKPIYLVVFKGPSSCESDISSWGGLHA